VKSYNIKENRIKFGEIQQFITLYRKQKYGRIMPLKCAPPRYVLKRYGGDISDDEYRSHVSELPPIVTMPEDDHYLHKTVIRKDKDYVDTESNKKQRLDKIKNTSSVSESLNLRRSAPVKLKANNLVDSMGLIMKKA
tara:strand:- start:637 stop:1047 length:411 start_codon:yes stop_codon:yes gene_type:complete